MFRIRKIFDTTSKANQEAIAQVKVIMRKQFPLTRKEDLEKIARQLDDPMQYRYRSILFVAENAYGKVKGFAMLLHMSDLRIGYLELISAAPGASSGGIGGVIYERVKQEAVNLGLKGLFFECSIDDPEIITDTDILKQNQQRLRFYERYGVFPVLNNVYASPAHPGDKDLYFLMYDPLGNEKPLRRTLIRKVVAAILERKYTDLFDRNHIQMVAESFADDPVALRPPVYIKPNQLEQAKKGSDQRPRSC